MKKLLTFGAGALLVTALALPAFAEQPPVPDGPIKMELTKKPVMFDHGIHTAQQCVTCHPTMPQHFPPLEVNAEQRCVVCHHLVDGEEPASYLCSDCHAYDPKDKSSSSYFGIMHARKVQDGTTTCLQCHYEVITTRPEKKQELTACVGSACHPKS